MCLHKSDAQGPRRRVGAGSQELIDSGLEVMATDGDRTSRKRAPRRRSTTGGPFKRSRASSTASRSSAPGCHRSPRPACCSRAARITPSRPRTVTRSSTSLPVRSNASGSRSHTTWRHWTTTRNSSSARPSSSSRRSWRDGESGRDDVAHVAKLARLTMSEDELDKFTEQLGQVSNTPAT